MYNMLANYKVMNDVKYDLDKIDPNEKEDGPPVDLVKLAQSIPISLGEAIKDIKVDLPDPWPVYEPDPSILEGMEEKYAEEAEIRKLQLEIFRKQHKNLIPKSPKYNSKTAVLSFAGKNIQIPLNTLEASLCAIILKNKSAMQTQWSWDVIAEKWGNESTKKQRYTIHRAAKRIRDKIAKKTGIEDSLLITTHTIQIHPDYI